MSPTDGVCSECNQGKHFNCPEVATDSYENETIVCRCFDNDHVRPTQ